MAFAFRSDSGHARSADSFGVGEAIGISVKAPDGGRVVHFANNHIRAGGGVSSFMREEIGVRNERRAQLALREMREE